MKKLELKHLAPYLPYGLKGVDILYSQLHFELIGVNNTKPDWEYRGEKRLVANRNSCKPILRPLSDLIKGGQFELFFSDLSEKAKKMDMSDEEWDKFCFIVRTPKGYDYIPHWIFQDLIKQHFDLFGLIPKGLAIDINQLDKETSVV